MAEATMPARAQRRVSPALEKAFQFVTWLIPTVEGFPRSQKFLLGDRMQGAALDLLETLVEATYTRESRPLLRPHVAIAPCDLS
jgi:hypothetical protein